MGRLTTLKQIADDIAALFGSDCEIVIHDLKTKELSSSIVYIVNGHVTGRSIGDGPSNAVFEAIRQQAKGLGIPRDQSGYLMKTADGKILKCSTSYIQDDDETLHYVFSINFDVTRLCMIDSALHTLVSPHTQEEPPKPVTQNVNDLLDQLIERPCRKTGRPYEQGGQGKSHPVPQRFRRFPHHKIRRQGFRLLRYFQIHLIQLY